MTSPMPTTSELLELFARFHLLPILMAIALVGVFSMLSVATVSLLQSLGEVSKAYYIFLAELDESKRRYRSAKHTMVNYVPNIKESQGDRTVQPRASKPEQDEPESLMQRET